ncbi:MAG TPA: hypothetical protein VFZ00_09910 [Solirubrobacter sp.]|nr:hypothetical protein [Solirubrobacter sp.]
MCGVSKPAVRFVGAGGGVVSRLSGVLSVMCAASEKLPLLS